MLHFISRSSIYLIILSLSIITANAQKMMFDNEYKLWKNGAPGSEPKNWPEPNYKENWPRKDTTVTQVTEPTIRVYRPKKENNTGVAIVLCPGGGYRVLEMGHEGYQVAEKLQEMGITVAVLKYRHYDVKAAMQDGQRAVAFIRSKAKEWEIDERKIGLGGFSAGAHLSLNATLQKSVEHSKKDEIDRVDNKPNFLLLVYGGYTQPEGSTIAGEMPPAFLVVSADDHYHIDEAALLFFHKLSTLNVPSELHVYQNGGHGYGLGWEGCQCNTWPALFRNWLITNQFIKSK